MIRIETFAEAQAIGVCIMAHVRGARLQPVTWDGFHSESCGWCEYPQDVKLVALDVYNRSPEGDRQRAVFFAQGRRERLAAIRTAQGYGA